MLSVLHHRTGKGSLQAPIKLPHWHSYVLLFAYMHEPWPDSFSMPLQSDTCKTVRDKFGIPDSQFILMNPGIDCSTVIPSVTKICLELGTMISYDCALHQVQPNETCTSLLNLGVTVDKNGNPQPLALLDLYRYNPGLRCDTLPISTFQAVPLQVSAYFFCIQVQRFLVIYFSSCCAHEHLDAQQVCLKPSSGVFSDGGCEASCKRLTSVSPSMTCNDPQLRKCPRNKDTCAQPITKAKLCVPK